MTYPNDETYTKKLRKYLIKGPERFFAKVCNSVKNGYFSYDEMKKLGECIRAARLR